MPSLPEPLPADVIAAAQRGEKNEAITLLRERTGMGLPESKAAVEAWIGGHSPLLDTGSGHTNSVGSPRVALFIVIGLALALIIYFFLPLLS